MLNTVTIMGRVVSDPTLKKTTSGISVVSFTLAVDRDQKGESENRPTDFIDCVAWRNTAEFFCNYFSKGRLAVVLGSLQTRNWEDSEGKKRKAVEVLAERIYFAHSKKKDENPYANTDTDECPF